MIRLSTSADLPALETIYPAAFPDEDLLPLVRELLAGDFGCLSLVAEEDGKVKGHALFTPCSIEGGHNAVALLGPLAVAPPYQAKGLGSALVKEGASDLTAKGFGAIFLLGDPNYYSRFGFVRAEGTTTPHPIPKEWFDAWQVLKLNDQTNFQGRFLVPDPWDVPAHLLP